MPANLNPSAPTFYERLLGAEFTRLHSVLREFHRTLPGRASGELTVERGASWLAKWLAHLVGLPAASAAEVVELTASAVPAGELWVRRFGAKSLTTVQRQWRQYLLESAGPLTFCFHVVVDEGGLRFDHRRTWLLGFPIPRRFPKAPSAKAPTSGSLHRCGLSRARRGVHPSKVFSNQ